MNVRYRVELEEGERQSLTHLVAGGSRRVRQVKRAQILLAADQGCADEEIARTVHVGTSTVYRTKRRFVGVPDLVDTHYPDCTRIQIVLDNLSTHTPAALYEAFAPAEARRVLRRVEFHYLPKHASWLNMVEIEIGLLVAQCLARRIPDIDTLRREVGPRAKCRWRPRPVDVWH